MDPDQINELSGAQDIPLAFRMLGDAPGIAASLGFGIHRGSNTIMRGGFMDDRKRGPGKLGGFARGSLAPTNPTSSAYYGSSARRARLGAAAGTSQGKMVFGKGSRVNNVTARPRVLNRFNSLTAFNASNNTAFYSPFQFMARVGDVGARRSKTFRDAFYGGREIGKEEQVFQRGMVSMITAGRKMDVIERKAKFLDDGTAKNRAGRKLLKSQEQVKRLATMNNPSMLTNLGSRFVGAESAARLSQMTLPAGMQMGTTARGAAYVTGGNFIDRSMVGMSRAPSVGLTGNLMASAGATAGSRAMQGYVRGALGQIGAGGLTDDALKGANRAVSHLAMALSPEKLGLGIDDAGKLTGRFSGVYAGKAAEALDQGVFKTLGVKRTMQAAGTKKGAMVLGARTAAMAIPGLNVLATASLVYSLGQMGGELIKSGANLAKDAVKSMKGSIDKPLFGMGYKDNEIAATSRARGVMAIQNSRLNARSMLGSEAGMMAAHFG
jgi:hypothetical protein